MQDRMGEAMMPSSSKAEKRTEKGRGSMMKGEEGSGARQWAC